MRLCILAETYPSTTQTFVYEPIEWLRQAGHLVDVITERRGEPPKVNMSRFPALLVPPWLGRASKIGRLVADPFRGSRALAAARRWARPGGWTAPEIAARAVLPPLRTADYVLAHFGPMGARWLPPVAVARRRFAVYFHGQDATALLRTRPGLYAGLVQADVAAVTNSEYIRGCLIAAGFDPNRVGIARLGVPQELSTSGPPALERRRILTIARLVPKKGIADSLRAFAEARPALGEGWRYQIVGDGPMRAELAGLAAALGLQEHVEFSGTLSRADTLAAFRDSSVFVLASRTAPSGDTEGTPVSILEAASIGLPVLSTVHAGIPETLPPEAAAEGWLVREGDVAGLARALTSLAPLAARRSWGDRCRSWVRSRHSPAAHVEGVLTALERLAKVPSAPIPALQKR